MRTRNLAATAAVLAAAVCVAAPAAAQGVTETFDQTYALSEGGRISLENVNGDLRVATWGRNEVRVEAVKEASSQELLDGLEIEVESRGDDVRIRTHYPSTRVEGGDHLDDIVHRGRHSWTRIQFTLTVPAGARLGSIDLVNGDMDVAGVTGGVRAELVNGTIRAEDLAGAVSLSTVNGGIEATYRALGLDDRIELDSVNGTVELSLPASASARVRVETVHGRLSNDFGLEVRKHKYVGAEMDGMLGAGGADIEVSTVNGGVKLLRF